MQDNSNGTLKEALNLKVIFSVVVSNSLETLQCNRGPKRSDFHPASFLEVLFVR